MLPLAFKSRSRSVPTRARSATIDKVDTNRLVARSIPQAKFLELYYLSIDPEFSETLWRLARLSPAARETMLETLHFVEAHEHSFSASITQDSCVILPKTRV